MVHCNWRLCCRICALLTAVLLFALGTFLLIVGPMAPEYIDKLIRLKVTRDVPLRNNASLLYASWVDPPAPIYLEFWLFNVTNDKDVIEKGDKPHLKQVGPITYRQFRVKENIEFHPENGTVSYNELRTFHYIPELSILKENDTIRTVNLVSLALAGRIKVKNLNSWSLSLAERVYQRALFTTLNASDFLWGYEDKILKNLAGLLRFTGITMDTKLGLMYKKNNSRSGRFNVYTGVKDINRFLHVHSYKDEESLTFWTTNQSNMINGTDGSNFGLFLDPSKRVYLFAADFCRSIYVEFVRRSSVRGIPTFLYTAPSSVFANTSENQGFCTPTCHIGGVLNISSCSPPGAPPMFLSQPHLYEADKAYNNLLDGLEPSEDCKSEMEVEPTTGATLRGHKKLQVNALIQKIEGLKAMAKLPERLLMPVMWANESVIVGEKSAAAIRKNLVSALEAKSYLPTVLFAVGATCVALGLIICAILVFFHLRDRQKSLKLRRKNAELHPSGTNTTMVSAYPNDLLMLKGKELNGKHIQEPEAKQLLQPSAPMPLDKTEEFYQEILT